MDEPKIGDKVRFSSAFCKLVGPSAKAKRGVIVHVYERVRPNGPFRLSVLWHGDERAKGVLSSNLARAKK